MTLNDLLDTYRRHCEEQWSADERAAWGKRLARVRASGVCAGALNVGDLAPDLSLPAVSPEPESGLRAGAGPHAGAAASAAPTSLYRLLADGPVVLKFVPGRGCPYTTLELRAYQRIFEHLRSLGGQLLVISARDAQDVALHRARDALSFPIVADPERIAAGRFGLLVPPAETADASDPPAVGEPISVLPATFVVGTDRRIAFAFIDPDPRQRAEPAVVARVLASVATPA